MVWLDNAYGIDPYVSYIEPLGELYRFSECPWYVCPRNLLTLPVVVLSRCHAFRLVLTPAVAQGGILSFA